jgi:hypothetical protein
VLREGKMVDAPVVVRSPQIHTHTPGIFLLILWVSALLGLVMWEKASDLAIFLDSSLKGQLNSFLFSPNKRRCFYFGLGEEGTFTLLSCSIYFFFLHSTGYVLGLCD